MHVGVQVPVTVQMACRGLQGSARVCKGPVIPQTITPAKSAGESLASILIWAILCRVPETVNLAHTQ